MYLVWEQELISVFQVKELNEILLYNGGVSVGAAVTLSEVEAKLEALTKISSPEKTRVFKQILKMFHWFAGKQIRNCGTLGGKHVLNLGKWRL